MTTNAKFTKETTAQEVVDAFGSEIAGKTGELSPPHAVWCRLARLASC